MYDFARAADVHEQDFRQKCHYWTGRADWSSIPSYPGEAGPLFAD